MYIWEYYPPSGRCREIRLEGELCADESRGFYVCTGSALVGLYASEKGPVFFVDRRQYVLEPGHYRMEHIEREKTREFRLSISGNEVYSVEYDKPRWIDDSLNDEEICDFFLWLHKRQNNTGFHSFFTV